MRQIETVLRAITMVGGVIGAGSIVLLMVLTVVTVAFRAIGIAFPGTYQIAELLLIPAVSFSLAYAGFAGTHTRVELVIDLFPPKLRSLVEAVVTALGGVFWLLVTYAVSREAMRHFAEGEVSPIIGIPVTPFRVLMIAALVLFCGILLFQAVQAARGQVRHDAETGDYS